MPLQSQQRRGKENGTAGPQSPQAQVVSSWGIVVQRNTLLILVVFLLAQVAFQNLQSTKTTTAMGGAASGIPGRIQTKAATTTTAAAAVIMNDKDKDDIAEQVVSKLTQQFWNPNNNANATAAAASTVVTARGHEFDDEIRALLSHVLVIIVAWWDPSDMVFLGHTLGTIRDWNVQDLMGALTVVIVTNDEAALSAAVGHKNDDWIHYYQVNMGRGESGRYMPFYHRHVIENYLLQNDDTYDNHTLPAPTTYAYFETDSVVDGPGMVAWAYDTILLQKHIANGGKTMAGVERPLRQFWRWEWNENKKCVAMNGQTKPLKKGTDNFVTIGGRPFVFLTDGKFSGIYVVTPEHMMNYYKSGDFWKKDYGSQFAREHQLYHVTSGGHIAVDFGKTDNTLVPIDEATGTLDMLASVHHQSDKYPRMPWPFGKLCFTDVFTDP